MVKKKRMSSGSRRRALSDLVQQRTKRGSPTSTTESSSDSVANEESNFEDDVMQEEEASVSSADDGVGSSKRSSARRRTSSQKKYKELSDDDGEEEMEFVGDDEEDSEIEEASESDAEVDGEEEAEASSKRRTSPRKPTRMSYNEGPANQDGDEEFQEEEEMQEEEQIDEAAEQVENPEPEMASAPEAFATVPREQRFPSGTVVRKHFLNPSQGIDGWFNGQVASFEGGFYWIHYEDGDEEQLSEEEVEQGIAAAKAAKVKSMTVWAAVSKARKAKQASQKKGRKKAGPKKKSSPKARRKKTSRDASSGEAPGGDDGDKMPAVVAKPSARKVTSDEEVSKPANKKARASKPTHQFLDDSASDFEGDDDQSESEDLSNVESDSDADAPKKKKRAHKDAPKEKKKSQSVNDVVEQYSDSDFSDDDDDDEELPSLSSGEEEESNRKAKKSTASEKTIDGRTVLKMPYASGKDLELIAEPQAMFDDMIGNVLTNNGENAKMLLPLVKTLNKRPLRVATMCSGTESPVLALDMLQKSIRKVCSEHLKSELEDLGIGVETVFEIEHVFSCEIEPFKQAYIQRNFHPPILFRDIRELGDDKARTAFGGLTEVPNTPGCVDMLVAGTSCVDYSHLNNRPKTLDQKGESGQTFWGMMNWILKALPSFVLIENVYNAPWEVKVKIFEDYGYTATFLRVDTKDYYIPQTRQRGYLFAVQNVESLKDPEKKTEQWASQLSALKRPASASLDDFMLSNDDPRVLLGRARLTAESGEGDDRAGRTDWTKCETRHQLARSSEDLGDKRPLTGWSETGLVTMPAWAWTEWVKVQVDRIKDLLDINELRMAQNGVDCVYKTMVWNLSQNVDRDTMGRLGLCQCLTPTGVPYVTSRGGPLVGEELLLLQGIPAHDLQLTRESEAELKDLAGNAMSSTVVGASMICALLASHKILPPAADNSRQGRAGTILPTLVPPPLVPVSSIKISQSFGKYEEQVVDLGPGTVNGANHWSALFNEAWASARKCPSEGAEEALPADAVVVCQECGHTSSRANAFPARTYEEHVFPSTSDGVPRVEPSTFRKKLVDLLPMRVCITLTLDEISKPSTVDAGLWDEWQKRTRVVSDRQKPAEFRFSGVTRSHIWTAHYDSRDEARLEMRFQKGEIIWLLFLKAPTKQGSLRDVLERPVARLRAVPPSEAPCVSLMNGSWEVCVPGTSVVELSIEGKGTPVPSWRNRLGLKREFESEVEFEELEILLVDDSNAHAELKAAIDGVYKSLPKCGGACGSLRKKKGFTDLFFFLESGRKTMPDDDMYVFSSTCHKTAYGEYRDILLRIDPDEKFRPLHKQRIESYKQSVKAFVPGAWVLTSKSSTQLVGHGMDKSTVRTPGSTLSIPIGLEGWKTCPLLASCSIPMHTNDKLVVQCKKAGKPLEVNLEKSNQVFQDLSSVLSRLSIPSVFDTDQNGSWHELDSGSLVATDGEYQVCPTCAPPRPNIMWAVVMKGNRITYVPMEDGTEAAAYERALKRRPHPWVVRLELPDDDSAGDISTCLNLQIGCNAVSLAYRAFGLLPSSSLARQTFHQVDHSLSACTFDWRVVPHIVKTTGSFPKLTFTSNKNDPEASQPPYFNEKHLLRTEQLRSLKWMQEQEATTQPFDEEEVTEAILPHLNWRAEARVKRPVLVRGGIVADEVGYGKTAITLGLIDSTRTAGGLYGVNGSLPKPPAGYSKGYIHTPATLVVVPGHLTGQWPNEIKKFLPSLPRRKVHVIKTMNEFNRLTVADIEQAEIVVVSFSVLSGPKYFSRLARFSGIDPNSLPQTNSVGRQFNTVYDEILSCLKHRVSQITDDVRNVFTGIVKDASSHEQKSAQEALSMDGKKASYKNGGDETSRKKATKKLETSEIDPWNLKNIKDYRKMTCPPLEMFFFNRVVIDEFTYLDDKDRARARAVVTTGLHYSFFWGLSGTPRHANFNDIQVLAGLLRVHLGVDEVLPGSKFSKAQQKKKEQTGLESMSHYLENRSIQWHERRHKRAQTFLNRFVRQNIAEIDEIPTTEHFFYIDLPPAERAIYLELETFLKSLEMDNRRAQRSRKRSTGDRESRIQEVLRDSDSGEEALLKCCSHFNMTSESSKTAVNTIKDIIAHRKRQRKDLENEMIVSIAAAYRQRERIESEQLGWRSYTKAEKGEVVDPIKHYEKAVIEQESVTHGADEEIHELIHTLVRQGKKKFMKKPNKTDAVFAEVNLKYEGGGAEDDGENTNKRKRRNGKLKNPDKRLREMKVALRDHLHKTRALGKEITGRVRSLRYIEQIQQFMVNGGKFTCSKCGAQDISVDEVGVLSSCGHFGCLKCLERQAGLNMCICAPSCSARITGHEVVSSAKLGLDREDSSGVYGAKLTAIVGAVKEIVKEGDRIVVFCQFDDLKEKVADALNESGVDSLEFQGGVNKMTKALQILQKVKPDKGDPRVVLLKMDDEQSAGLNLTNLNHAIFVHPLLADNQQDYDAYETQAIGRIRRFGQKKTVHVRRFLVKETIDTSIYKQRGGRAIAETTDNDQR